MREQLTLAEPPPTLHCRQVADRKAALSSSLQALEAWDPVWRPGVQDLVASLWKLKATFDRRRDPLPAAVCTAGIKLLERIDAFGGDGRIAAVDAVAHMLLGLREACGEPEPALPRARPEGRAPGTESPELCLALDGLKGNQLDEILLKLGTLTPRQVDTVHSMRGMSWPPRPFADVAVELGYASTSAIESALRLQLRAEHGQLVDPDEDPWGPNPL